MADCDAVRWSSLLPILTRPSKFAHGSFEPGLDNLSIIQNDLRILVVGAGGLGCEILKDLALSGFQDIHVIDLDTIDVSNLNRQFLFRKDDVNKYKSEVAAAFIMKRVPACKVTAHNRDITTLDEKFYRKFNLVIAGLDNIAARQWLNRMLVDLVKYTQKTQHTAHAAHEWWTYKDGRAHRSVALCCDDCVFIFRFDEEGNPVPDSIIPFIDGGTEAFAGQCRVFIPHMTCCFECSMQSAAPQRTFAACTIRNIPRLPEHCIAYALKVQWNHLTKFESHDKYEFDEKRLQASAAKEATVTATSANAAATDEKTTSNTRAAPANEEEEEGLIALDKDNMEHMLWIFKRAEERASKFGIRGVTFSLTLQVVKNIIPAIASTNALIAAACVNEAFKILSLSCRSLQNYYMYFGGVQTGISTENFNYERNADCDVCQPPKRKAVKSGDKLKALLESVEEEFALEKATFMIESRVIYQPLFHGQYAESLEKSIEENGIASGAQMVAVDRNKKTKKLLIHVTD